MPVPLPSSRMRLPFRYLRFAKLVIQAQQNQQKRRIRVFSTRTMRPAWFVCICRKKLSSIRSIFRIPKPREPQSPLMYSPNTRGCLPGGRDEEARNPHNTSAAPQRLPGDGPQVRARLLCTTCLPKQSSRLAIRPMSQCIRKVSKLNVLFRQAAANAMLTALLVCQVLDAQGLVSDEYPGASMHLTCV